MRNCDRKSDFGPSSPRATEHIKAEARAQRAPYYIFRTDEDLTRIIETCVDCENFDGHCNDGRFPDGCTGRRQWLKALSSVGFRECPKWIQ